MPISRDSVNELERELHYQATWLPNESVSLGDIGLVEDGIFRRSESLSLRRIPFGVTSKSQPLDLTYSSLLGTSVDATAEGEYGGVSGRTTVRFTRAGAVYLNAPGCRTSEVADQAALGAELATAYRAGAWDPALHVVTTVVTAHKATPLVPGGVDSFIELALR
jgi:hypothetical protein